MRTTRWPGTGFCSTYSICSAVVERQDGRVTSLTILLCAKERGGGGGWGGGVDGPSLDRSCFSRLQPISFLFFNPSSGYIGWLVARTWRRMPGRECGWNASNRRSGVISKSAMPPKKSSSQQTLFACGETVLNSFSQPGVVLMFRWNSSLTVLRQTVLRHPTVLCLSLYGQQVKCRLIVHSQSLTMAHT